MHNERRGPKKRARDFESVDVDEAPSKRLCKYKGTDWCSALAVILLFINVVGLGYVSLHIGWWDQFWVTCAFWVSISIRIGPAGDASGRSSCTWVCLWQSWKWGPLSLPFWLSICIPSPLTFPVDECKCLCRRCEGYYEPCGPQHLADHAGAKNSL